MSNTRRTTGRRPAKPAAQRTDLDAVEAELELEPFTAVWKGREWNFTHMQLLDTWELMQDAEGLDRNEQMALIFEMALGPEQWEDFRQHPLPVVILQRLFDDYNAHCGISLGK